jgi:hypothetical protein
VRRQWIGSKSSGERDRSASLQKRPSLHFQPLRSGTSYERRA